MDDNYLIRNVHVTDIPYLCKICLKTGFEGKDATSYYNDEFLLGLYYAAPYAFFSSKYSFVIEDKTSFSPKGYILGTEDTVNFKNKMNTYWLPQLRERCAVSVENKSEYEKSLKKMIYGELNEAEEDFENNQIYKKYPSHFHIDLMPELQGKKLGHDLISHFIDNLRQNNIKGVHLGVDKNNERACKFYQKEGFEIIKKEDYGFIMGMDLKQ